MGYLSQKKKSQRENVFLAIMAFVLMLVSFAALFFDWVWLKSILFHLYVLSVVVWLYSLFIARFGISLLFLFFVIVNYFHIASSTPILFNHKIASANVVSFKINEHNLPNLVDGNAKIINRGFLALSKNSRVPIMLIDSNGRKMTLLSVDMKVFGTTNIKENLRALRMFVLNQNDQVLIVGDLGMSPWEAEMRKFLTETGLEIKNRLVFSYAKYGQRFWEKPSFFVLGFRNVGLNKLEVQKKNINKSRPEINLEIAIN